MSTTVKVDFIGVCTRIPQGQMPLPQGVTERFVFVDASRGGFINGKSIPPHEATLEIDPASIESMSRPAPGLLEIAPGKWQMKGVRLSIVDALAPLDGLQQRLDDSLPSLQAQAGGATLDLNFAVVRDGDAAAYFDVTQGQRSVAKFGEAAISTLYIETPAKPQLLIHTFWDNSDATITFNPPAKIVLKNAGGFDDSTYDFYLHYKIFTAIPQNITVPGPAKSNNLSGLTAGCSNSSYP